MKPIAFPRSAPDRPTPGGSAALTTFAWLSIAAVVVTIALKSGA